MDKYPFLANYLAGHVDICPRCGGENISYGSYEEAGAAGVSFPVDCEDCGLRWWDIYTLTSVLVGDEEIEMEEEQHGQ